MSLHIDAQRGEIAEYVITAGDPDRVTYLAERYLTDAHLVSRKRSALCYTGFYDGVQVTALSTGMGVPSMLIYATELFRDYGCKAILRVGTGAGFLDSMQRHEIVLSQATSHTSAINDGIFGGTFCPVADFQLLSIAARKATEKGLTTYVGNTICNDRIYRRADNYRAAAWKEHGILCSEMEGAALYTAAAQFHGRALMMISLLSHIGVNLNGCEHIHPLPESEGRTMDDALQLALATIVEDNKHGSL